MKRPRHSSGTVTKRTISGRSGNQGNGRRPSGIPPNCMTYEISSAGRLSAAMAITRSSASKSIFSYISLPVTLRLPRALLKRPRETAELLLLLHLHPAKTRQPALDLAEPALGIPTLRRVWHRLPKMADQGQLETGHSPDGRNIFLVSQADAEHRHHSQSPAVAKRITPGAPPPHARSTRAAKRPRGRPGSHQRRHRRRGQEPNRQRRIA